MKKSLLRRMAPLVAGILLAAPIIPALAAYPYITGISWPTAPNDNYALVTWDHSPSAPWTTPSTFYWWLDSQQDSTWNGYYNPGPFTSPNYHPTNYVGVYVYGTGTDFSWASVSRTYGTYINNGP